MKFDTACVALGRPDNPGDPLNTPVIPASNFLIGAGASYSREDGTDGWRDLEEIVGRMEGGSALAFSSGMAAVTAVLECVPAGGRIVLPDDCYQGVAAAAEAGARKQRWSVTRLDVTDLDAWILAAQEADLLWLESPTNPLLRIADLAAICSIPRRPGCIVAVDNTFATPLNQRPLHLGADLVVHSATKFMGGHSDLLCGIVVSANRELVDPLLRTRTLGGAAPGALEAFLTVRGLRTLAVRLEKAQDNARQIAEFLATHKAVDTVRYPGLKSDPGYRLATQQLGGYGSIISFDVAGGASQASAVCEHVEIVRHATSLGSVETTMERRGAIAGQEHLPSGLLRISVGIENGDDLVADLSQALERA